MSRASGYTRKLFSAEEDAFIRKSYQKLGPKGIAVQLGRPVASVRARANKLGIVERRGSRKPRNYVANVAAPLPERNPEPISPRLARLAQFDPLLRRVVNEKTLGLPPGKLCHAERPGE